MNILIYDAPTAFLIASLVFLIMPIVTWTTLVQEASVSVVRWCVGGVILSAGLLLIGLRVPYPDLAPLNVGYLLALIGNLMHLHALQLELKRPSSLWMWLGISVGITAVKELLYQVFAQDAYHFVWGFFALAVSLFAIGYTADKIKAKEASRSARWIAMINYFGCFILGLRSLAGLFGLANPDAMNVSPLGLLTIGAVIFIAIFNNVALIGIYLERSQRRAMQLMIDEEKARASAELGTQIASIDRQRSLGELAAGLAHELGQPMTGILMDTSALTRELGRSPLRLQELCNIAMDIDEKANRARQILGGIRNFIS